MKGEELKTRDLISEDNKTKVIKYLVRNLEIMTGEDCKRFSLHYVELKDGRLSFRPFDKERAGYEYKEYISIVGESSGYYDIRS